MRDLLALSVVLLPRLMERLVIRSDFHLHHRHSGSHSRIPADPSSHQFGMKESRFSEVTIRDRYGGQISVPGSSNLRAFIFLNSTAL